MLFLKLQSTFHFAWLVWQAIGSPLGSPRLEQKITASATFSILSFSMQNNAACEGGSITDPYNFKASTLFQEQKSPETPTSTSCRPQRECHNLCSISKQNMGLKPQVKQLDCLVTCLLVVQRNCKLLAASACFQHFQKRDKG